MNPATSYLLLQRLCARAQFRSLLGVSLLQLLRLFSVARFSLL
jgi:hypothetical protein